MGMVKTMTTMGAQVGNAAMVPEVQLGKAASADSAIGPKAPHTIVCEGKLPLIIKRSSTLPGLDVQYTLQRRYHSYVQVQHLIF